MCAWQHRWLGELTIRDTMVSTNGLRRGETAMQVVVVGLSEANEPHSDKHAYIMASAR